MEFVVQRGRFPHPYVGPNEAEDFSLPRMLAKSIDIQNWESIRGGSTVD